MIITKVLLNGRNYLPIAMDSVGSNVYWKRKLGYINRKIKEPAEDNPTYDDLECENLLTVMTWLISSMDKCQHWPFILQNCKTGLGCRCQSVFFRMLTYLESTN